MRKAAIIGLAGSLMLASGLAQAVAGDRMFTLGGSLYWIDVDAKNVGTMDFTGGAFIGSAAFNNHVALRGSIYGATWDVDDELEVTGSDIQMLLGNNLVREGFKYYVALGVFNERIGPASVDADDREEFSGAQLGVGFGYNWSHIALDYTLNFRAVDDYADSIGIWQAPGAQHSDVIATSTVLALSLRF